jgi:hypothetical protein
VVANPLCKNFLAPTATADRICKSKWIKAYVALIVRMLGLPTDHRSRGGVEGESEFRQGTYMLIEEADLWAPFPLPPM